MEKSFYFIRGNKERGAEVIAVLESKGGVNKYNCTGAVNDNLYFINKEGIISTCDVSVANTIYELCEELTLPEEWKPKFKKGATARATGSFRAISIIDVPSNEQDQYIIRYIDDGITTSLYESYITEWIPKRGETVLVRDSNECVWIEAVYSFTDTEEHPKDLYCTVGGSYWNFCIPFDENKLGKVTEN